MPCARLRWDPAERAVVADEVAVAIATGDGQAVEGLLLPAAVAGLPSLAATWRRCLSTAERARLAAHLPPAACVTDADADADAAVAALLRGSNLHFGNQLLSWGASVCLGEQTPLAVVQRRRHAARQRRLFVAEIARFQARHALFPSPRPPQQNGDSDFSNAPEVEQEHESGLAHDDGGGALAVAAVPGDSRQPPAAVPAADPSELSWERSLAVWEASAGLSPSAELLADAAELYLRWRLKRRKAAEAAAVSAAAADGSGSMLGAAGSLPGDIPMRCVSLTGEQMLRVERWRAAGRDVRWDAVEALLAEPKPTPVQRERMMAAQLEDAWALLVQDDLPASHAIFRGARWEQRELAASLAEHCAAATADHYADTHEGWATDSGCVPSRHRHPCAKQAVLSSQACGQWLLAGDGPPRPQVLAVIMSCRSSGNGGAAHRQEARRCCWRIGGWRGRRKPPDPGPAALPPGRAAAAATRQAGGGGSRGSGPWQAAVAMEAAALRH
eukprot:SM000076S21857  [mRNA]  locus=s76:525732:528748:+ [translate_table: standard]